MLFDITPSPAHTYDQNELHTLKQLIIDELAPDFSFDDLTVTQDPDGTLNIDLDWADPPTSNNQQDLLDRLNDPGFLQDLIDGDANLGNDSLMSEPTTTPSLGTPPPPPPAPTTEYGVDFVITPEPEATYDQTELDVLEQLIKDTLAPDYSFNDVAVTQNPDGTLSVDIDWTDPTHENDQQALMNRISSDDFLKSLTDNDPNLGPGTTVTDVTTTPALALGAGWIVLIIVGILVFLGLLVGLAVFLYCWCVPLRKKREREREEEERKRKEAAQAALTTVVPQGRRSTRTAASPALWAAGEVLPLLRFN